MGERLSADLVSSAGDGSGGLGMMPELSGELWRALVWFLLCEEQVRPVPLSCMLSLLKCLYYNGRCSLNRP